MNVFARIFEFPESQVLVTKDYDEERGAEKPFGIVLYCEFSTWVEITIPYKDKTERDHYFDSLTKEKIRPLYENLKAEAAR